MQEPGTFHDHFKGNKRLRLVLKKREGTLILNWSDKKVIKDNYRIDTVDLKCRGYYMAARGYEFYLRVLKVSRAMGGGGDGGLVK